MSLKSTANRYGGVVIAMHWASAIAIVALLGSGFRAADMADPVAKAAILRFHVGLGVSILVMTLLRLAWWALIDRKPDAVAAPHWQALAARVMHGLFYVVIFGMAASGIGLIALSGAGSVLFGGSTAALPEFTSLPPRVPHGIGARLMVALALLHAGAALYHQFVLRDRLLARMGIGRA